MKKILAIIAATALLLTGCSQVGAAATVGDTKITQATVQGSIDSILSERGKVDTSQMQLETGEALNRSQLRFHLFSRILRAIGEEIKIEVTKAEIDTPCKHSGASWRSSFIAFSTSGCRNRTRRS